MRRSGCTLRGESLSYNHKPRSRLKPYQLSPPLARRLDLDTPHLVYPLPSQLAHLCPRRRHRAASFCQRKVPQGVEPCVGRFARVVSRREWGRGRLAGSQEDCRGHCQVGSDHLFRGELGCLGGAGSGLMRCRSSREEATMRSKRSSWVMDGKDWALVGGRLGSSGYELG
jgi:hypothetical protein